MNSKSDKELIDDYKKYRKEYVIGILFDRYVHLVFASCMKYLKNAVDAQDSTMEIFESLSDKLLKYDIDFFKSWLYTTTRNYCLMHLRKKKLVDYHDDFENLSLHSVENDSILHLTGSEENEHDVLIQCLSDLKEEQRVCIELMYIQGLSYKGIADKTGFELKKVKSCIQNGKRKLKLMLENIYEGKDRT